MKIFTFSGEFVSASSTISYQYSGAWWTMDAYIHWEAIISANGAEAVESEGRFKGQGESPAPGVRRSVEQFIMSAESYGALRQRQA